MKRRFAEIAAFAQFGKIDRLGENKAAGENAFVLTAFERRFRRAFQQARRENV